jgi:cytochrome o ubiquinol oxidase operon protein cyoD
LFVSRLFITTNDDDKVVSLRRRVLAFGVLIVTLVVSGSLWIMANLNANMMPPSAIMEMQR